MRLFPPQGPKKGSKGAEILGPQPAISQSNVELSQSNYNELQLGSDSVAT